MIYMYVCMRDPISLSAAADQYNMRFHITIIDETTRGHVNGRSGVFSPASSSARGDRRMDHCHLLRVRRYPRRRPVQGFRNVILLYIHCGDRVIIIIIILYYLLLYISYINNTHKVMYLIQRIGVCIFNII
jgi:hypothetical protein